MSQKITPINSRKKLLGFKASYAFVIGINYYPKINAHLTSAAPDAREIARILKHRQGFDHVELVMGVGGTQPPAYSEGLDQIDISFDATGAALNDLLDRIQDPEQAPHITHEDSIVFYYAGHGKAGEFDQGPAGYLLPSDAKPESARLENKSLIPMERVFEALKVVNCKHTLLILDCCFAGKFRYVGSKTRDAETTFFLPMYEERFERYKREQAWQVLVSAGPLQTAADWMGDRSGPGKGIHSPFAEALISALEGEAEIKPTGKNLGDGVLTAQELFLYLWNKVESVTQEDPDFDIQYPDLFPMGNHRGGQFIFFDPNNKLNFANRQDRNPYKGLKPFKESDQDLFFGRTESTRKLVEKFLETDILVVTALSGGGKSSIVQAGLFPEVRKQNDWEDVQILAMRPGAFPMREFEKISPQLSSEKPQILFIDQYEELFVECHDKSERASFEHELVEVLRSAKDSRTKVVITLRSDYEWQLEASGFGRAFWNREAQQAFLFRLAPMSLDELREVLVAPAWVEAYDFASDELVSFILEEISYAPGALPMLSFAMSELYALTDKDERIFTFGNYREKLGGVTGALSRRAGEVHDSLPNDQQKIMKEILLRMIRLNDGSFSRRRVLLNSFGEGQLGELDYPGDAGDTIVSALLKKLESASLVLFGMDSLGQRFVEPAHDSLINFWPQCLQWIQDFGRENLVLQRQLWQATVEASSPKKEGATERKTKEPGNPDGSKRNISAYWDTNPKLFQVVSEVMKIDPHLLSNEESDFSQSINTIKEGLAGQDLEIFTELMEQWKKDGIVPNLDEFVLTGVSRKLLESCFHHAPHWLNQWEVDFIQKSWEKRTATILNLKKQRDEAREARKKAEIAAISARTSLMEASDPTIAYNMAYGLFERDKSPESLAVFNDISARGNIFYRHVYRHIIPTNAEAFSPDGKFVVTGDGDGNVKLWGLEEEEPLLVLSEIGYEVSSVAFDGNWILAGFNNGTAILWDRHGKVELMLSINRQALNSVAISPDGNTFLTGTFEESVTLWNRNGDILYTFSGYHYNDKVGFSPNGDIVLCGNDSIQVYEFSPDNAVMNPLGTFRVDHQRVGAISFSADQKIMVAGLYNGTVGLWDLETQQNQTFKAHKDYVSTIAIHPDGGSIITGTSEEPAKLWDFDGNLLQTFQAHGRYLGAIRFTGDGKSVLVRYMLGDIIAWDLHGNSLQILRGHINRLTSVSVKSDTGAILTSSWDQTARLWEPGGSHQIVYQHKFSGVSAAGFCGDRIMVGLQEGTVCLLDPEGGLTQELAAYQGFSAALTFAFHSGGFLTGSQDGIARLWDYKGNLMQSFTRLGTGVSAIASNEKSVLVGYQTGDVILFNYKGEIIQQFDRELDGMITSLAISPGGKYFLSGSHDTPVKFRIVESNDFWTYNYFESKGNIVAFSPDGEQVVVGLKGGNILLFDLKGNQINTFEGHTDTISAITFSDDGQWMLSGSYDGTAILWNSGGSPQQMYQGMEAAISSVAFSPDNKTILTGFWDRTVALWDLEGNLIQIIEGPAEQVRAVSFTTIEDQGQEKQGFITATWDNLIQFWDLEGNLVQTLREKEGEGGPAPKAHDDIVYAVVSDTDKGLIFTCASDKTAKMWDLEGNRLRTFIHREGVKSLVSNGEFLVTASGDNAVNLWGLDGVLRWTVGNEREVSSVSFAMDGNTIITGSYDGAVKLFDLDGNVIAVFKAHDQWIESLAVGPDGNSILTGSSDGSARLWDFDGNLIHVFPGYSGWVYAVAFDPKGKYILIGSGESAHIWHNPLLGWNPQIYQLNAKEREAYGVE